MFSNQSYGRYCFTSDSHVIPNPFPGTPLNFRQFGFQFLFIRNIPCLLIRTTNGGVWIRYGGERSYVSSSFGLQLFNESRMILLGETVDCGRIDNGSLPTTAAFAWGVAIEENVFGRTRRLCQFMMKRNRLVRWTDETMQLVLIVDESSVGVPFVGSEHNVLSSFHWNDRSGGCSSNVGIMLEFQVHQEAPKVFCCQGIWISLKDESLVLIQQIDKISWLQIMIDAEGWSVVTSEKRCCR